MHPNPAFLWDDAAAMRTFMADNAFAHIFATTQAGPMVAHAPIVVMPDGHLRFHLARSNRLTGHLDGATALISVMGSHAYFSPDWYVSADQVPTWIYCAVEAEGPVRRLDRDELVAQLEALSAHMEAQLAPKPPWDPSKMSAKRFDMMLGGIVGFELEVAALRGTRKLNQHKSPEDVSATAAALRSHGHADLAVEIERDQAATKTE